MPPRLVELADHYLAEYLSKIERATAGLSDESLWWRANERSNSIANLILHLDGNLSQWVLGGLAGEPVVRHRSAEFSARAGASRSELLARLTATVERCRGAIAPLDREALAKQHTIQGYEELDGAAALFHVVEHMSYHTGQIVLLAKALLPGEVELEFYPQHRGE